MSTYHKVMGILLVALVPLGGCREPEPDVLSLAWKKTYSGNQGARCRDVLPADDGGYLILATIIYFPEFNNDVYLLKVDEAGNQVWSRTWSQGRSGSYDLIQCSDGNYLVAGSYIEPGITESSKIDFLFIKFDSGGNEIWVGIFGDPRKADKGSVLAETAVGGYIAAGDRTPDWYTRDADISLVKINRSGQLLWRQNWPATHTNYGAVFQHHDGGYVIAGSTTIDHVYCIVLIKAYEEEAKE